MKAALLAGYGEPSEVYLKNDVEIPKIKKPNDVLIEIHYSSLNISDWKCRRGWSKMFLKLKMPYILGCDAAGIVKEVGKDVKNLKVGDRVLSCLTEKSKFIMGGHAEYVVIADFAVAKLPDNMSFKEGGSFSTVAVTAYQMFLNVPSIKEWIDKGKDGLRGKNVLVIGSSGGVGTIVTILAKHYFGAYVYSVCSKKNHEYAKSLGADFTIDYKTENFDEVIKKDCEKNGKKLDLILDVIGGGYYISKGCPLMDGTGFYVFCGMPSFKDIFKTLLWILPKRKLLACCCCGRYPKICMGEGNIEWDKPLEFLAKYFADNDLLKLIQLKEYSLDDIVKAHVDAETLRTVGRIVIKIKEESSEKVEKVETLEIEEVKTVE